MKSLTEIVKNPHADAGYKMLGISEGRRLAVEIAVQSVCQKYFEADKTVTVADVLIGLDIDHKIYPKDEADLAYIVTQVVSCLHFYGTTYGLRYEAPGKN